MESATENNRFSPIFAAHPESVEGSGTH